MRAEPGKRYRHYKGGEYTVLHIGRLESDPGEEYVVYRMEYDAPDYPRGTVWLRKRADFEGQAEAGGAPTERFTLL